MMSWVPCWVDLMLFETRVHISSDEVFSKILKKPSIVHKKWYLIGVVHKRCRTFLVFSFWLLGFSKKFFFVFAQWTKPRRFIWGSVYFCTMDGFFRILEKRLSELICTRLYIPTYFLFNMYHFSGKSQPYLFLLQWLWHLLKRKWHLKPEKPIYFIKRKKWQNGKRPLLMKKLLKLTEIK